MSDAASVPSPSDLTERIGKLNERIDAFQVKVDLWEGAGKGHFAAIAAELGSDRDAVARSLHHVGEAAGEEWHKVVGYAARAFDRLESEVEAARADLEAELADDVDTYKAAVDRQRDSWRGHLERMRVQAKLGEMEARDVLADLEHAYEAARPHLEEAREKSDEGFGSLRERGREVMAHLRDAARAASRKMM